MAAGVAGSEIEGKPVASRGKKRTAKRGGKKASGWTVSGKLDAFTAPRQSMST